MSEGMGSCGAGFEHICAVAPTDSIIGHSNDGMGFAIQACAKK